MIVGTIGLKIAIANIWPDKLNPGTHCISRMPIRLSLPEVRHLICGLSKMFELLGESEMFMGYLKYFIENHKNIMK
jgi:hypothetical protein